VDRIETAEAVTSDAMEPLILVDEDDRAIGEGKKLDTHLKGLLHRAFSVFVFRSDGRLLVQRRAFAKYHSGGLWANTCCGHPRPGEDTAAAAARRLGEEFGFTGAMTPFFRTVYRGQVSAEMIEHEFVHCFYSFCDPAPAPDPEEVLEWRWIDIEALLKEIDSNPETFSYWMRRYSRLFADDLLRLADGARQPGRTPPDRRPAGAPG